MAVDPAALFIHHYPDPILLRVAKPIPEITPEVRAVAARMIELMKEAEGIGLPAPQVGLPWRLFVAHVPASEDRSPTADPPTATATPTVYINPVLSALTGAAEPYVEGCLSLPD